MYVMLTQKLSKGFKSWKDMVHENEHKLEGFKGRVIFAGSHAEDDNSMVVIMHYDDKEGLMAFKNDEELTKARQEAGALTETTVMTVMTEAALLNFPNYNFNWLQVEMNYLLCSQFQSINQVL